jgi:hypothetical protein
MSSRPASFPEEKDEIMIYQTDDGLTYIHTMTPDSFSGLSDRVVIEEDGKMFSI